MQAITTKYFGPSDVLGTRIKATCRGKSRTFSWNHAVSYDQNHRAAAQALAKDLGWKGQWVLGVTHKQDCVWVCIDKPHDDTFTIE